MPEAQPQAAATAETSWIARLAPHLVAGTVAAAAAVLMTWPLAAQAGSAVLRAIYFWDAYANTMIMGSRVDALFGLGPLSLYDAYYFAPLPQAIVFNENHFGLSLLFAPFYLLGGPIWGYNLTLLTSLALSVYFTHLLVRRLTGSAAAGIVSGVAFAFCPYVAFELGRIQLVATQWIPACFFFLHRAFESGRRRDIALFWGCYVLQIGTCLYYAMFLMPLLGVLGGLLAWRTRPARRFYLAFVGMAASAGALAISMVYPYFAARASFDLERSHAFASGYDGQLGFFTHVHEFNRTWTALHHPTALPGAPEEIAFPGLLVLVLGLGALTVPLVAALRARGARPLLFAACGWLLLSAVSSALTLAFRSFLPGALAFALGAWLLAARGHPLPFAGTRGAYLATLLLAVTLFLGLEPLEWRGAPVRGLYYYLHTYFPGYDGIRKVSRQAVMTTFLLAVLAGFGSAALLAALRGNWAKRAATATLLSVVIFELRCFPYPMEHVFAAQEVPAALRYVASLPSTDLVAAVPQNAGRQVMRGDAGMALHDYLALHHKHRFVNGQSSYEPPVTALARRSLERLPDDAARRALLAIGTRHLIVYGEELTPDRQDLVPSLLSRPAHYELAFSEGAHSVVSLLGAGHPSFALLEVPQLPPAARLVPASDLQVRASLQSPRAPLAVDGRTDTHWTTGRFQAAGQFFEVSLSTPRRVQALEISAPGRVMDVPASFRLTASLGEQALGTLLEQPVLRLYREQVFSPKTFVQRLVFAEPVLADRLRITLGQGVPGHYFSIHELCVYAE
jgi:hypothetical protein